jgi:hypothetical protein
VSKNRWWDLFDSQEVIANRISKGEWPEAAMVKSAGVPHQNQNYFWYRTIFVPSGKRLALVNRLNYLFTYATTRSVD